MIEQITSVLNLISSIIGLATVLKAYKKSKKE